MKFRECLKIRERSIKRWIQCTIEIWWYLKNQGKLGKIHKVTCHNKQDNIYKDRSALRSSQRLLPREFLCRANEICLVVTLDFAQRATETCRIHQSSSFRGTVGSNTREGKFATTRMDMKVASVHCMPGERFRFRVLHLEVSRLFQRTAGFSGQLIRV